MAMLPQHYVESRGPLIVGFVYDGSTGDLHQMSTQCYSKEAALATARSIRKKYPEAKVLVWGADYFIGTEQPI